jgi:hypothetical protein
MLFRSQLIGRSQLGIFRESHISQSNLSRENPLVFDFLSRLFLVILRFSFYVIVLIAIEGQGAREIQKWHLPE